MTYTIEQNIETAEDWKILEFEKELEYFKDESAKSLAKSIIKTMPDYFFVVAASSTGKYHPDYAQGQGGLRRHVKAAMRIAVELMRLEMYQYLQPAHDYILIALLYHDAWKHGEPDEQSNCSRYTTFDHPIVASAKLKSSGLANQQVLDYIGSLIETHMGEWTFNYRTGAHQLQKPQTAEQCFVHLCDYLASRKCLEFNFDVEYEA